MSIETQIHDMIIERVTPIVAALSEIQDKVDKGGPKKAEIDAEAVKAIALQVLDSHRKTVVECKSWDGKVRTIKGAHPDVPKLVAKLQMSNHHDRNLYVYGPAGTGKTTAGIQLAEALGVDLYIQGTAMSKYDLVGFRLPSGEIVRTAFMDAWEKGGMIILDDIDRSDPRALSSLNAATANGTCDFSHCGMGLIPRHPDCIIFATGNTSMNGQDVKYVAAAKQDAAFRDRFTMHRMELDEGFELSIVSGRGEFAEKWTKRVQRIRRACQELGGNVDRFVMASMRASIQGADLFTTEALTQAEIEEAVVFKGAGDDVTKLVYSKVGKPSTAYKRINNWE